MVEGKSWQSMKERFKRSIVKRLDLFGLDDQQEEQLRQGGRRGEKQKVQFAETLSETDGIVKLSTPICLQ